MEASTKSGEHTADKMKNALG